MTIVNKAAMTQEGSKPVKGRSTFPINQRIAGGYRFGLYQPCYVEDYNPDETIPVKSAHDIRSMNLKSPMLGNVSIHKDFFDVPFTVLLPLNYEKLFVQPGVGEDVDAAEVGLNVENLPTKLTKIVDALAGSCASSSSAMDALSSQESDIPFSQLSGHLDTFVKLINFLSLTFSSGSLFSSLGLDLSAIHNPSMYAEDNSKPFYDVDLLIDELWNNFFSKLEAILPEYNYRSDGRLYVSIDNQVYILDLSASDDDPYFISKHRFVELSYDADFVKFFTDSSGDWDAYQDVIVFSSFNQYDMTFVADEFVFSAAADRTNKDLSLAKIFAYQVACAEFYTNSKVDYMYTAQLYRQFVSSYLFDDANGLSLSRDTFSWNGVEYLYDFLSAHNISAALVKIAASATPQDHYKFLRLLFGYNRSLRYVDYFTGGRPQPYPVLGVTTPVVDGSVSIVDTITKNWFAKFLNQAYRVGRKLSDYTKGLFPNAKIKRDYHDPMWLGSISDMVDTPETQNTGAAQISPSSSSLGNSTTSNFVSNGQRYAFSYETPQFYGVIIGIVHFDIARYYPHVIERNNFNVDRNDYFNPYLQLVGDQPIYKDELFSGSTHSTFAYTGRDMQYKQKVDRCFGIFSLGQYLPGWLYVAPDAEAVRGNIVQNPSFIRAFSTELNKFYTSMTGFSPATWFHFLVINTNDVNASRPMIANPQLD